MNLFRTKSVDRMRDEVAGEKSGLRRVLGTRELILLGIGAVIGAGIFSTLGTAANGEAGVRAGAGPALVLSFLLLGFVCAFAALCYSELTAMIPVAGSAYNYAFATLGQFVAWIIGWDLILEYAVGNVAVAISWSSYLQEILGMAHLHVPDWLGNSYGDVLQRLGKAISEHDEATRTAMEGILANAPHLFGHAIVINLPAVVAVLGVTWILVRGVGESALVNSIMVGVKLVVLALFVTVPVVLGRLDSSHWHPFVPNGWNGIHQGAAVAFFAFIGFDAISTAAEEAKEPQKTMPRGILWSLGICTVVYMLVGLVATGLVDYRELTGSAPLARALDGANLGWLSFLLSVGAVIATTSVLLVFQLGQPRIFFSMARDGLLPRSFCKVHPRYRTPHLTTIATGIAVAIGAALMDDDITYDLTNIGTLFAFALVCAGVLVLRVKRPDLPRPFKVPFVWVIAPVGIIACVYVMCGLTLATWIRFGIWLAIGLAIYFGYGARRADEVADAIERGPPAA